MALSEDAWKTEEPFVDTTERDRLEKAQRKLMKRVTEDTRPEPPFPPPPLNYKVTLKCADGTEKKSYSLYPVPGATIEAQEKYAKSQALKALRKQHCKVVGIESWMSERV